MKIAIITNVPDKNSPMFSSFVQYASEDTHIAISSTRFEINEYLSNKVSNHNYIKGQKLKLQYLFAPLSIAIFLCRLMGYFMDNSYQKMNKNHKNLFFDFLVSTKSIMNNLYVNFEHFIFLVREKPDFVVSLCVSSCGAARLYKMIFSKSFAYALYEVYPNHNLAHDLLHINKYHRTIAEKLAAKKCSLVFSPTSSQFGRLLKLRYHLPQLNIVPIFFTNPTKLALSTTPTIQPIKMYYHGMFDEQRRLPQFVTALGNFKTSPIELYLRGFGPEEDLIRRTIDKFDLNDKVFLLEPLPTEKLAESAANFDIGLSLIAGNSANNRFLIGFKSNDYLMAGLAQIGPDSYILGKYLKCNKLGLTYKAGTVEEFSSVISTVAADVSQIDVFKKNAQKIIGDIANFKSSKEIFLLSIKQFVPNA